MPDKLNRTISFSKSPIEVKFVRLLFKVGYIGIAIVFFLIVSDESILQSFDSWIFMALFVFCFGTAHLALTQFIWRLDLNVYDKKIVFYRYLNNRQFEIDFNSLHKVSIGFYIKFTFSAGTVWFNEARNKALIGILNKYFTVQRSPTAILMRYFDK